MNDTTRDELDSVAADVGRPKGPTSKHGPNKTQVPPPFVSVDAGALAIWHRPKLKILRVMKGDGLTAVVTLLMESEGAHDIGRAAQAAGLEWVWAPLHGADVPPPELNDRIVEHLSHVAGLVQRGGRVLIHCSAGVHRTGMFTYALLRFLGLDAARARHTLARLRTLTAEGVGEDRLAWGDQIIGAGPDRVQSP